MDGKWIACAVISLTLASACREAARTPEPEPAEPPQPVARGERARFTPPADGLLSVDQVEMYAVVQKSRKPEANVADALAHARGLEDLQRLSGADLASVEASGYDRDEYEWVEKQVVEASLPGLAPDLERALRRLRQSALDGLRQRLAQTHDPMQRARIEAEIARLEAAPTPGPPRPADDATRRRNRELLERHRPGLETPEPAATAGTP